ncbi:RNA methyltransferase [Thalassomonas actiniarum]|uniref:RNA methyltransferase n=1 Tax=Thalassomonas actiniarum TaxID=485447 RepID=A0AAE9YRS3_9GAMM|nr:RNA methyltransferase [Thalassomonas actiniarum]WDE00040.1 RNA methyltransferase [Thalassomonas actiniarum]
MNDVKTAKQQTVKVSIGLTDPKSPSNVGAVMRAAGCYQADAVYYTGQRYARAAKFNTDTKNVAANIPLTRCDSLVEQAGQGVKLVCVELVEGATPLPAFKHPERACYIFGPEDGTLSQQVIDQSDAVVYVPTTGCMNLAATVNVLLYDRLAKSEDMAAGDELIRQSRDTNNKVKVKSGEAPLLEG